MPGRARLDGSYEGSVPVRIGGNAVRQRQLDVYSEVIDAFMLEKQAVLDFGGRRPA